MESQAQQYKLEGFPLMLDAHGATASAYHLRRNCSFQLIVINGDGKIIYNADSGFSYEDKPAIHEEQIEKSLKDFPEAILDTDALHAREADQRRSYAREILSLAEGLPVQAYRETQSFLAAFPKSEEAAEIKALAETLIANPKVNREIDAESEYLRMVAPEMKKATLQAELENLNPLFVHYQQAFGDTEFGSWVKNAIEDRLLTLSADRNTGPTPAPKRREKPGGF